MTFIEAGLGEILRYFGGPNSGGDSGESEWVPLPHGTKGYKQGLQRGNLKVYFDGQPGMGVHVVMPGEAVRQWESEWGYSEGAWLDFFRAVRGMNGRFRRVDVAFDDAGQDKEQCFLSMDTIQESLRNKHIVTPFHDGRRLREECFPLHGEGEVSDSGETIYLGSRKSEMFVRIYNKALEKEWLAWHWLRVELEAKGAKAEALVDLVLRAGFAIMPAVLKHYVDFKEPSATDSNKSRWETAPWWAAFLDHCEKLPLTIAKRVGRTIDHAKEWVKRQTAPLLAVIVDSIYADSKVRGRNSQREIKSYLFSLIADGRGRYRAKHRNLLAGYVPGLVGGSLL